MMRAALLVAGIALLMAGCVSTTVNQEWKAPSFQGYRVQSALVVGLPPDSPIGNSCSDEFVKQLRARGIAATAGYEVLPPGASKETAMAKAREMGHNSLLVCRYLERRTQLDVYPSGGQSMILMPDSELWWGGPDYVENRYDVFGTSLYDSASGKGVWSALSDTYAARSGEKIIASYVKTMLEKMEKQGLIGP